MSRDRSKFLICKIVEKCNVSFGKNSPSRIVGKRVSNLSNGRGNSPNVLYVDGMKHNLVSVSEMCD